MPCIEKYILAVETAIKQSSIGDKDAAYKSYLAAAAGKSHSEARDIAADILGQPVYWDCDRMWVYVHSGYSSNRL